MQRIIKFIKIILLFPFNYRLRCIDYGTYKWETLHGYPSIKYYSKKKYYFYQIKY